MSVPSAAGTSHAATAAAEPDEDPPGILEISHGFFVMRSALFSPLHPIAYSSRFNFPILTIPACFKRSVTVDS